MITDDSSRIVVILAGNGAGVVLVAIFACMVSEVSDNGASTCYYRWYNCKRFEFRLCWPNVFVAYSHAYH